MLPSTKPWSNLARSLAAPVYFGATRVAPGLVEVTLMKILIADKFPGSYQEELVAKGHKCVCEPDLGPDQLPEAIPGYDALVVRSTKVAADTIAKADSLKIIIRAGAGTNTIDKRVAADHGIYVCNVPGKNAIAVAELTMALLLAIDRRIPENVAELRAGQWNKKRYSQAQGLYGKTLGIVGLGAIGIAVAERAKAFGLHLLAVRKPDRSTDTLAQLSELGVEFVDDLGSLAERSDILSFHVPAATQTQGVVSRELLERMRPGSIVINTSRGDVVDEDALLEAMDSKGIRAGLDVYDGEPGSGYAEFDSKLARHPNVYGTHHIGASTEQAQDAVAEGVVHILAEFDEGKILHCVNMEI